MREDAEIEPVREVLRVELSPPPSPTGEPPMPALSADGDRASLALMRI